MAGPASPPTRWFYVREGARTVFASRDLAEAQAQLTPGRTIAEGVGTVCDPEGDPITDRWR